MGDGDPLREADNPIWALLGHSDGHPSRAELWIVPPGRPWLETLETTLDGLEPGRRLIVAVPRPLARTALAALSGKGADRRRGPSPAAVTAALEERGLVVESTYGLWPSARSPRIAFPAARLHMLFWLQRTGVLGGGGRRLWARWLARSPLFTPLVAVVVPGVALIARRGSAQG